VERELALYHDMLGEVRAESVYIGGGTPSHLDEDEIASLFASIRRHVKLKEGIEISFETHPENASPELYGCLVSHGVNRINIGVESFDDALLLTENRRHTAAQALDAYGFARKAGLENINVDTIYGLKGQTLDNWETTLQQAAKLMPASLCAYYLRTKKGTLDLKRSLRMAHDYPSERALLLMHIMTFEAMSDLGYDQDIVDWFVRDRQFFHTYQKFNWQRTDEVELLGIGVSSYSYMNGVQYYNINDIHKYQDSLDAGRLAIWKGERLTNREERMRRSLMLGLKTRVSRRTFLEVHGVDVVAAFPREWELLNNLDLVNIGEHEVELSYKGKLFADEVGCLFYSPAIKARMDRVDPVLLSTTLPLLNPS
jgi:oxygen-independent coproporphyrinogen-3 oxidase